MLKFQKGQGLVEYALMLCLIGVVILVINALGIPLWICILGTIVGIIGLILTGLGLAWLTEKFPQWPEYALTLVLVCVSAIVIWALVDPTIINVFFPR